MQTSGILTISLHSKWVSGFLLLQQLPSRRPWNDAPDYSRNRASQRHSRQVKVWNACGSMTEAAGWTSAVAPSDLLAAPVPRSCPILHRFACYRETFAFSTANTMTHPPAIEIFVNPIKAECDWLRGCDRLTIWHRTSSKSNVGCQQRSPVKEDEAGELLQI